MGLLNDKVAVITGGISGLGRASALRYAAEGARVIVADINAERGANAAAEMSAGGASIEFIQVDVTSKESQQALFDDVVSRYGQVDTVLAAAGVSSSGYISGEVSDRPTASSSRARTSPSPRCSAPRSLASPQRRSSRSAAS